MRSAVTVICAVMLACTASVVAQDPQSTKHGPSPTAAAAGQLARQGAPGTPRSAPAYAGVRPTSAVEVPPDASVVTIEGVCDRSQISKTSKTKDCKTVITREEIEDIMDLLIPGASQAVRRQYAINYARLVAASGVAQQKQLEKDPHVVRQLQAQSKADRMQVLSHALYEQMAREAESVSMSEIQKYYEDHLPDFEEGEVLRLSLPKAAPTADGRPLDELAVAAKAEELHQRAQAGEDFEQLQHDAYVNLGIKGIAPGTKLNMVRRTNLPADETRVFDLQTGEVTPVLDSLGSLVVLKLVSKQSVSAEAAAPEIKSLLHQARMQEQLESATKTVKAEFNLKYLDLTSEPELFPPPREAQQSASSGELSDQRLRMTNRPGMTPNARRALRRPSR